jgi:membrane associated rhomboid family serine protease
VTGTGLRNAEISGGPRRQTGKRASGPFKRGGRVDTIGSAADVFIAASGGVPSPFVSMEVREMVVFPISDDNTGRRTVPVVNYVLIAINVAVFVFLQGLGSNYEFTFAFSTVPREIVTGQDEVTDDRQLTDPVTGQEVTIPGLQPTPIPVYLTLLTSMFMHGGIMHLLGNMLFLWIFGDNVEDDLGHGRYIGFYLLTGLIASLSHVLLNTSGEHALIPSLGASGAISGVLGGYLVLHPKRRVRVILLRILTDVPAVVAIGLWFLFQLISGLGLLGGGTQTGGVAYAAHIGGFIAGVALVKPFTIGRPETPEHPTRAGFAIRRESW